MNPGGVRGGLLFNQISGGEQPGEVTFGEMFTVQPFSNTLVVKTCTGAQIEALLEQQFVVQPPNRAHPAAVGQPALLVHARRRRSATRSIRRRS